MEKRIMDKLRENYLYTETGVKFISDFTGSTSEDFFDALIFLLTGCNDERYKNFLSSFPNSMTDVKLSLYHTAMVSDFYIKLNCNRWLNLDKDDIEMINKVRNAILKRNTKELFEDRTTFLMMRNVFINFSNLSGLDKVILYKSLTERDITLLSNFNPLFMEEYNHFNVIVDMEFIKKHFNIWNRQFGEESAYNAICDFICKLYKFNIEQISDIVIELVDSNDDEEIDQLILDIDDMNIETIKEKLENYFKTNIESKQK